MPGNTLLCGKRGRPGTVTVDTYLSWDNEAGGGWSKKPDFIRRRLFERYINPVRALNLHKATKDEKNGFYIMAVSCLLIETLVSFWRGWETTEGRNGQKGKSRKAFKLFFRTQPRFREFRGKELSEQFYKNIRCGILHQGEATGGWTIHRSGPLFDGNGRINAVRFHDGLALAIHDYVKILESPAGSSTHRPLFDKKMKAVLRNCK
jgi:hypothetical protein